jgi:hypothetical protein
MFAARIEQFESGLQDGGWRAMERVAHKEKGLVAKDEVTFFDRSSCKDTEASLGGRADLEKSRVVIWEIWRAVDARFEEAKSVFVDVADGSCEHGQLATGRRHGLGTTLAKGRWDELSVT